MKLNIHGLLVVQSPPERYQGIDRYAWEELGARYYTKELSPHFHQMYETIKAPNLGPWFPHSQDLSASRTILEYSKKVSQDTEYELIAYRTSWLSELCETFELESAYTFLGIDIVAPGEWSLLRELPPDVCSRLGVRGDTGLFETVDERRLEEVCDTYKALEPDCTVEPLGWGIGIVCVSVWRVHE